MKKTAIYISSITFLALLVLIGIREIKGNYFKSSVSETHLLSLKDASYTNVNQLTSESIIIQLTNNESDNFKLQLHGASVVYIEASKLLSRENKKVLKDIKGDIILFSNDVQITANAWVILSRLGYKNVILLIDPNDETFQPDISAGLK